MTLTKNLIIVAVVFLISGLILESKTAAQLSDYQSLTSFTKERVWESKQGSTKTGRLVSLGARDEVEIAISGKPEPFKLRLAQLSEKDQEFIARLREKAYKNVLTKSNKLATAKEVRNLYQKLSSDSLVPPENRKDFEALLEVLNRHAATDSISIPGEFIKPKELEARKEEANQLIVDWIKESRADFNRSKNKVETYESKKLNDAIRKDPTSVEAVLLLSLLYGLKEGDLKAEERRLTDAIETAQRYAGIASDHEKYNMAGAFNNLAVNCCRQNRINKALRHWNNAADFADEEIKRIVGENLVRLTEFAETSKSRGANTGLSATSQELKKAEELFGTYSPETTTGGWKLVVPKDADGKVRANISFVLAKKTKFVGQVIKDNRCINCYGSSVVQCPNTICRRGKIPVELYRDRYMRLQDGKRVFLGKVPAGTRWDPCPTCRGNKKGVVKCPCCSGTGSQE